MVYRLQPTFRHFLYKKVFDYKFNFKEIFRAIQIFSFSCVSFYKLRFSVYLLISSVIYHVGIKLFITCSYYLFNVFRFYSDRPFFIPNIDSLWFFSFISLTRSLSVLTFGFDFLCSLSIFYSLISTLVTGEVTVLISLLQHWHLYFCGDNLLAITLVIVLVNV